MCATQVFIGRRFGARPGVSVPVGLAMTISLLVAYVAWCPWLSLDYDFFHGELFTGALVLDHVLPIANDPYTTLSIGCYLAAWIAALATRRFTA
jgi:hypothetical protein